MRKFKEHWHLRFESKFRDPSMSFWWGIENILEVRNTIGVLSSLLSIVLMFFFGYSFFASSIIGIVVDVAVNSTLALISTLVERRYRLWQEARSKLAITLNRLALNKTRKSYACEDSFKD